MVLCIKRVQSEANQSRCGDNAGCYVITSGATPPVDGAPMMACDRWSISSSLSTLHTFLSSSAFVMVLGSRRRPEK